MASKGLSAEVMAGYVAEAEQVFAAFPTHRQEAIHAIAAARNYHVGVLLHMYRQSRRSLTELERESIHALRAFMARLILDLGLTP